MVHPELDLPGGRRPAEPGRAPALRRRRWSSRCRWTPTGRTASGSGSTCASSRRSRGCAAATWRGLRYDRPFRVSLERVDRASAPPRAESYDGPDDETGLLVVTADYVTAADGTGLVHTSPRFGEDDYKTGLAHGLPLLETIDSRRQGGEICRGSSTSPASTSRRRTRRSSASLKRARPASSTPSATATATRSAGAATGRSSTTPPRAGSCPPRRRRSA